MNDNEINATAQGLMLFLMEKCQTPTDTLSVLLCTMLLFYEKAKIPTIDFTIEEFAQSFGNDMVKHWHSRTIATKGTETIQ